MLHFPTKTKRSQHNPTFRNQIQFPGKTAKRQNLWNQIDLESEEERENLKECDESESAIDKSKAEIDGDEARSIAFSRLRFEKRRYDRHHR